MDENEHSSIEDPAEAAAKRREAFRTEYAAGDSQKEDGEKCAYANQQAEYGSPQQTYDRGNQEYGDRNQADAYWQNTAGRDPQEAYHRQVPAEQRGNPETLGIIGMICGIISIPAAFSVFLGLILGIIGTACSAVARRRGEQSGTTTAGLVTGIIGVVLSLIILLVFILLVLGFTRGASYYYYGY